MLGNRSPRQAVKTRKGRVEVVNWLKDLENHESRRTLREGGRPFDTGWMWKELEIPRPETGP